MKILYVCKYAHLECEEDMHLVLKCPYKDEAKRQAQLLLGDRELIPPITCCPSDILKERDNKVCYKVQM